MTQAPDIRAGGLREALEQIRATVTGDKHPRWSNDGAIYTSRANIADICEAALAAPAPAGREEILSLIDFISSQRQRDIDPELRDQIINRVSALTPQDGLAGWQPIWTAPHDGRLALVYRPLAENSGDQPVTVKRLIGGNHHCWESTVPKGDRPTNPTDGSCHVTHWMQIPAPPLPRAEQGGGK